MTLILALMLLLANDYSLLWPVPIFAVWVAHLDFHQ